ncbi:hypothetical protein MTR67_015719 [Solanum verrucosum]|uniref:Uncharacterized protein n=1 Tax=Solanum verrucosum TaxID=315347 RepID=A0AAF0QEI6_SOLVR|nr:hypothetical protein MTR67_015719 [Solanum verrucosum]
MGRVDSSNETENPQPVGGVPGTPWSTGLFDCHLDQTNAAMTALLPCVTFGQIAEVQDAGEMRGDKSRRTIAGPVKTFAVVGLNLLKENEISAPQPEEISISSFYFNSCPLGSFMYLLMMPAVCSHWIMGSKYRTKLRQRYNLVEAPYSDVVAHIFFPFCSLCQEFRELRIRGLDPTLGWNGIVAQQQHGNQQMNQAPSIPTRLSVWDSLPRNAMGKVSCSKPCSPPNHKQASKQ